jgi:glycosyltransferase involved in cell wall biosynthesis
MRIMMLFDRATDLDLEGQAEQIGPLEEPSYRRDVALVIPRLDSSRLQIQLYAVQGKRDDGRSLNAHSAFDVGAWRRLAALLRDEDIELIHGFGPLSAFYAAIAGQMAGIATMASVYNLPNYRAYNAFQYVWQRIQQAVVSWGINRVIMPSELLKMVSWRIRYPKERVLVVYPGVRVQPEELEAPSRESLGLPIGPLATIISPIAPDYGFKAIMDAVPKILQRAPTAHIAIVGAGPLLDKLRKQTRILPVHWLGEHVDVMGVMAASDVIVTSPRYDSLPRVVLEAAALGKPVVATRVYGISEVVDEHGTGLLVTYDDGHDLAVQTSRLLVQPTFKKQLGDNARKRAIRFSLETQVDNMTQLYEETVYATR